MNEEFLYGQLLAWTPVAKQHPPDGIPVLVVAGGHCEVLTYWGPSEEKGQITPAHWTDNSARPWRFETPSHWMPLPPLRPHVAWAPQERKPPGW